MDTIQQIQRVAAMYLARRFTRSPRVPRTPVQGGGFKVSDFLANLMRQPEMPKPNRVLEIRMGQGALVWEDLKMAVDFWVTETEIQIRLTDIETRGTVVWSGTYKPTNSYKRMVTVVDWRISALQAVREVRNESLLFHLNV